MVGDDAMTGAALKMKQCERTRWVSFEFGAAMGVGMEGREGQMVDKEMTGESVKIQ